MKLFLRICLLLSLPEMIYSSASAQADSIKYKERAAAVRADVWAWKGEIFAGRTVPAEYANESCVIMARKAVIEADTKKRINWALGAHRNFYYNSTVREMVKINDKASLEEFSQLSYRQFRKLNGWMSATSTSFVGARIIKPNGTMKEVNIDEAVLLANGRNDQQRKLAISDLQVGDILDYFVRTEEYSEYIKEPERLIFVFGDDHPILFYTLHCEIGNKYAIEYRSMNGAPFAKQTTNEDKDVILDIGMKDIPAAPTGLWMASMRELPAFRLNVLAGGTSGRSTGEVVKDVPLGDVVDRINTGVSYPDPIKAKLIKGQVNDILKGYDKHYSKLPKDSLASLIYYAYRFVRYYNQLDASLEVGQDRNETNINSYDYLIYLNLLLNMYKIDTRFIVMPYKHGPAIQHIMGIGDLSVMLRWDMDPGQGKDLFFTNQNMFTSLGYIPAGLEGQPCPEVRAKKYLATRPEDDKTPLSKASENTQQEKLQVSFNGTDMQMLRVKRHTLLTGKMKEGEQVRLLNFEDCYESERNALHVEKSIMDDLKKARKSKNLSEDYATALQKARASLKDRFKEEISSEFDPEPKDIIAWKVDNPGLRHTAPDLAYSTEFTVDGLIQRAGNNFLLNIGKVVNSPLKLTPSQRTRKIDIYMSYARTLDCTVAFDIPQGYTVQGVDKLNKTLDNDCGSVTTSAQIQGGQLMVHFRRIYKHDQEAADKWPQLLAIIDASTDFADQKVLLKKG
ncbi:MAG: DUF3857 domain-containing protein [Chitinophagaceae bacterium]|nr:DUF3857 domain-containing protein [Chitinophagaceae bacterium]